MFKEDPKLSFMNQNSNMVALEKIIMEKAINEYNLYPNKNWVDKCLQIYAVSTAFRGIILCGNSCTGKTSTLNVLIDSLTEINKVQAVDSDEKKVFKQTSVNNLHKIKKFEHAFFFNIQMIFLTNWLFCNINKLLVFQE